MKSDMKKTLNATMSLMFLSALLFNMAEATKGSSMGLPPFYDSTICYNNNNSRASYQKRPSINKDKNSDLQTTIQEDLKSAKSDSHTAPKQNQEDKVIEFIVSDVSGF